ncbi:hypothetical protein [Bradyrhizobium sp. STM 3809]|uniref:hypothetical protein n=1 Tax=Bradyrhizobium sp. STM 3809 TaxID=551936 RepID=UPI0002409896|nr:hypothetical protein [Bradyrhizobium sp. STM 3809]CCE01872.1 conserved hypothetical protein [Bradyrhizobium sp. STM 3809]
MTRMTSQDSEICDHARALASPVARAFVRIAMACRGVSETAAQQIYLDYIQGGTTECAPDHSRQAAAPTACAMPMIVPSPLAGEGS